MRKRPLSVSIIAWFMTVCGIINCLTLPMALMNPQMRAMTEEIMAKSPLPISVQYAFSFAALGVMVASGIGMLNRQNWSRWLYVLWTSVTLVISLITAPMKLMLIPSALVFLVIIFFLFRPAANRYFQPAVGVDVQTA